MAAVITDHIWTLEQKYQAGDFQPLTPEEILVETRRLIEKLEVTSNFVSDHVSNYVDLTGKLPEAKKEFLERIDQVLNSSEDFKARMLRPKDASCI